MVDVGRLPKDQRIAIARVEGAAQRLTRTPTPGVDPVDELREITSDPFLLGIAAGTLAATWWHAEAAQLVQQAGADMAVAAAHEREVRERNARRGGAGYQPGG